MAKLYIAGPMRGYPRFNFDAFFRAEELLRARGYGTINPARMDVDGGFDPDTNPAEVTRDDIAKFFTRDILAIVTLDRRKGDGLAMLDNWQDSEGAVTEARIGHMLGLKVANMAHWLA